MAIPSSGSDGTQTKFGYDGLGTPNLLTFRLSGDIISETLYSSNEPTATLSASQILRAIQTAVMYADPSGMWRTEIGQLFESVVEGIGTVVISLLDNLVAPLIRYGQAVFQGFDAVANGEGDWVNDWLGATVIGGGSVVLAGFIATSPERWPGYVDIFYACKNFLIGMLNRDAYGRKWCTTIAIPALRMIWSLMLSCLKEIICT